MDTRTPTINVTAKPLTNPVPIIIKMKAVIREETFPSRIDVQARLNPSSMALKIFRPRLISSLVRSKIKILASTAIPMERTNPAMPGSVSVICQGVPDDNLKIEIIIAEYMRSASEAITPRKR